MADKKALTSEELVIVGLTATDKQDATRQLADLR